MYIFLSILIVLACVLLIGVVLIQKSKGGGLASDYSGGNQFMGYRKTTDFVEKATWGLAIFICIVSIFASFAIKSTSGYKSQLNAATQTTAPVAPAQAPAAAAPAAENAPAAEAAETPAQAPAAEASETPAEDAAAAEATAEDQN